MTMSDGSDQQTSEGDRADTRQSEPDSVDRNRSNGPSSTDTEDGTIDEWRFGIDDVGPEGSGDEDSPTSSAGPEASADEASAEPSLESTQPPIEPEKVVFEHAAVVAVGVILTIGFILTAV